MELNWPTLDEGRVKRAKSVKFTSLNTDAHEPVAKAAGSGSEDYRVTLTSCTCADFAISQRKGTPTPCKHMIALAMKSGLLGSNGLTPSQQKAADLQSVKDRLALSFGYYYLFDDPQISDAEYDTLKQKYAKLSKE